MRITLKNNLTLNSSQLNWISDEANNVQVTAIYNFLESNTDFNDDYTQEAISFAKAAIDALMNEGEVDFANEFIKAKSFIGTPADCVLESFISSENNLFKKTSEAFTQGRSKYRIKFTTYTEPGNTIATTALPDAFGIINISYNLTNINLPSIEMASSILHETIHAELHRIKLSNNAGPNPLPAAQYNWYVQMWNIFGNGDINRAATGAEHSYMAQYFIDPIASGLREFDENTHPLENYKYFAWEGLKNRGIFNEYITQAELTNLANLAQIVTNDTHTNPCD